MTEQPYSPLLPSGPLKIGMLIYPGLTLLDLIGPQAALGPYGTTYLVWETLDPVMGDSGVSINPTHTFDTCPEDLDILFVPGGHGTFEVLKNDRALHFLRDRAERARYVTSVCTGAIILAGAGLLDGYKAATHWSTYAILEALGVEGVHERVVIDRNRITGGGVTAGIDFGLTLLTEIMDENTAKATQLLLEYDPAPPYNSGSPKVAEPQITAFVTSMLHEHNIYGQDVVAKLKARNLFPAAA